MTLRDHFQNMKMTSKCDDFKKIMAKTVEDVPTIRNDLTKMTPINVKTICLTIQNKNPTDDPVPRILILTGEATN